MATPNLSRSPNALFEGVQVGAFELTNRVVMAPLTRNRAGPGLVPGPFAAKYYAQRATAGLIIAEATQVSAQAQGYSDTPGCYTDDQVAGWRQVTDAVHAKGGTIFLQLWHTGRVSHTSFQKDGQAPVGPSAIRANTQTFIAGQGFVDVSTPRALEVTEIPGTSATPPAARWRPDSTGSNCTAPTATCSTPSCETGRTTARTPTAARSPTAPG
jgi:N-ethylmaleimide reductase